MAPSSAASSQGAGDERPPEKNAGLIMGTNNSSIVSKRSVERLYLPQPHFYRYFVRKPQRRSPTINRGYWLRMRAIDWVIRQFLTQKPEEQKVIINLGCGYDPIPFQWLATEPELCASTKFIDVDFDDLMATKQQVILDTPEMRDLLTMKEELPTNKHILIDSKQYAALGCDLRNLKKLEKLIKSVTELQKCMVLCIAEVSITYMATDDSDAVLSWSSRLSRDVTFCLLEQQSPDRPDNPFTATMLKHFAKLGTPLRSLLTYPGDHFQVQRFQAAGFSLIEHQSLWELWSDSRFLTPSQRMALDQVEPFDEWEEFALFASHYALIVAQTGADPLVPELPIPRGRRDSDASNLSNLSTRTVSPYRNEAQWFAYKYSQNPDGEGRTHHGSAYSIPGADAIGLHGGVGTRTRLSSTSVYAPSMTEDIQPNVPPLDIDARCCHTMTTLGNGQNILVGGRASPSAPMRDCWLQKGGSWKRIHDLPEPRYRHRAVAVVLPDNKYGVIIFGGKASASKVSDSHLLWDPQGGWQKLRSLHQDPMPRFGASFVRLGFNHGLLLGGMRQDGVICQGLWRWRLIIRDNVVAGIRFKTSSALDTSAGVFPWLPRLGASYSVIRQELLIIGGVSRKGCVPKEYEILSVLGSFSAFSDWEKEMELRVNCVAPKMSPDMPRPFLIGHSSHRTLNETTLIVGGGCTCFSFGSFWNNGVWVMEDRIAGDGSHWYFVKPDSPEEQELPAKQLPESVSAPVPIPVERTTINTPTDLAIMLQNAAPKCINDLDIGPCTAQWDPAYFKSKTSPTRTVVVHSSPTSTMNFQRKDTFNYTTLTFHTFLSIISNPHLDPPPHMYLRSISTTSPNSKPANLASDWPELATDFKLPPQLSFIEQNMHSNPLRISANLAMWLHYDVMANILFQIRGTKTLILFPPTDMKQLSFPPGSTTSTLDIFPSAEDTSRSSTDKSHVRNRSSSNRKDSESKPRLPPNTHPQIVTLTPGTALFIPPLWSHCGSPNSTTTFSSASTALSPQSPLSATPFSPTNSSFPPISPSTPKASPFGAPPPPPQSSTTESNVSIALNTFFHSLPPSFYAAGRDVYGNRDLAAYEDGRRDLERIVRRFVQASATATIASTPAAPTVATNSVTTGGDGNGDTGGGTTTHDKTPAHTSTTGAATTSREELARANGLTATTTNHDNNSGGGVTTTTTSIPKEITKAYLERLAAELLDKAAKL